MPAPLLPLVLSATVSCAMAPPWTKIVLPERGFSWVEEESSSDCDPVEASQWERLPQGDSELLIHTAGPEGSGRFWVLTVGIAPTRGGEPARGFCLTTNTLGWRSAHRVFEAPLEWGEDLDGDGVPELIIWSSFQTLSESPPDAALVAWVYRLSGGKEFVLDLPLTKKKALALAKIYRRKPRSQDDALSKETRVRASRELDSLGRGRCSLSLAGEPQ